MRCPTCKKHVIMKADFKLRKISFLGRLIQKYRLKPLLYNKLSNYLNDRRQTHVEYTRPLVIQLNEFHENVDNDVPITNIQQSSKDKNNRDSISDEYFDQLETIQEESEHELDKKTTGI